MNDLEPAAPRPTGFTCASIRCVDVLGAGIGLVILSPLLLFLGIAVRWTSPGPALFRATRVGRNGRLFTLYKFRSMRADPPTGGPAITASEDPRITRLGRILRRSKLDELPQLLNVFKGDMSLVGPRPEDPAYVALYSDEQMAILEAKPGMTSPASLRYRNEENELNREDWNEYYVRHVMREKLAIDGEYVRKRTVWSDIGIILSTIVGIARGESRRPQTDYDDC